MPGSAVMEIPARLLLWFSLILYRFTIKFKSANMSAGFNPPSSELGMETPYGI